MVGDPKDPAELAAAHAFDGSEVLDPEFDEFEDQGVTLLPPDDDSDRFNAGLDG